jgi:hypothetical protein
MTELNLNDDDKLVALLAAALGETDSIPPDALAAAMAAFDVGHLEGELAVLLTDTELTGPLAGVRSAVDDGRLVSFTSSMLTIELDLPAYDNVLVGQLDPPGPTEVELEFAPPQGGSERVRLPVDAHGRFGCPLQEGSLRLQVATTAGPVATPWVIR